jgi:hypothetical protein
MIRCSSTPSDMLVSDGADVRALPLHLRKNSLARMLARRVDGIFLSDYEQGEIGQYLFRHACLMGLEGLVSKHRDRPYRPGRSPHWIKVKNPKSAAMNRVKDGGWLIQTKKAPQLRGAELRRISFVFCVPDPSGRLTTPIIATCSGSSLAWSRDRTGLRQKSL